MAECIVDEDCQVGGTAAHIHHCYTHAPFFGTQDRLVGAEWLQHQFVHIDAVCHYTLHKVAYCSAAAGDNMGIHLQPISAHTDRLPDVCLAIYGPRAGNRVDHLLVVRQRNRARAFQSTLHVSAGDTVLAVHWADASAVARANMAAGNADIGAEHLPAGILLTLLDRLAHRCGGFRHVDDHAAPDPATGHHALTQHAQRKLAQPIVGDLRHQRADLRRSNIDCGDHFLHRFTP